VSRAFVREDTDDVTKPLRFSLPARKSPAWPAAAAMALLEAAYAGRTSDGEVATGVRWGDVALAGEVKRIIDEELALAELDQDRRLIQVARRYLRAGEPTA
jgi:hypothetical protein